MSPEKQPTLRVILAELSGKLDLQASKLDKHAKALDDHIDEEAYWQRGTTKQIKLLDDAMRGNGDVGYNTRIDRLEQSEKGRAKLLWIAVAGAVTGAIAGIGAWIGTQWK